MRARQASPPGAPFWAVAACLLSGAVLRALVYWASRSEAVETDLGSFPAHAGLRAARGAGLSPAPWSWRCSLSAGVARRWGHCAAQRRAPRARGRRRAPALLVACAGAPCSMRRAARDRARATRSSGLRLADDPMLVMPSEHPWAAPPTTSSIRIVSETAVDRWLRLGPKVAGAATQRGGRGHGPSDAAAGLGAPGPAAAPPPGPACPFLFVTPTLALYAGFHRDDALGLRLHRRLPAGRAALPQRGPAASPVARGPAC